jgi:hypothetical protein
MSGGLFPLVLLPAVIAHLVWREVAATGLVVQTGSSVCVVAFLNLRLLVSREESRRQEGTGVPLFDPSV